MFDIARMFQVLSDPKTSEHIKTVGLSILETAKTCARVEAKLDALLREKGIDPDGLSIAGERQLFAATLAGHASFGNGATADASAASVAGSGSDPAAHGRTRHASRGNGQSYQAPDFQSLTAKLP